MTIPATVKRAHALLLCVWAIGCASVDFEYPREASFAPRDTHDTRLGRLIGPELRNLPGQSGFHFLLDGIDALAARIAMADMADRSLDAQYFLLTDDLIGILFLGALLDAADRGVRVRLLLDDIQTRGYDAGIVALDTHPHFEVRIFNPFADRSSRVGDLVRDFQRVNRRMHNKSMTADNQVTIVGGRNIASEYFNAHEEVNFDDADVLAIGPVVRDVSRMFDEYWNHRASLTAPAFAELPADAAEELVRLRQDISAARARVVTTPYAEALRASVDYYRYDDEPIFTWAPYRVVYDSPDKSLPEKAEGAASIVPPLLEVVSEARREFLLISPYFVPQDSGVETFRELRERGVEVVILTNSLASTNHAVVHTGYAPARKPLLELGVRLHEMKPEVALYGIERSGEQSSSATLHTKAFIVDRERLFIGSFNWDPRSIAINTELGVVIDSPEMAGWAARVVHEELPEVAWELALDDGGGIVWIDRDADEPLTHTREPRTSFWQRLGVRLMRLLPIEDQL